MTAETELLPLPLPEPECMGGNDVFGKEFPLFTAEQAEAYARANLAELQREVATWKALHASEVQVRQRWQARAERLAEALRDMLDEYGQLHAKFDLGECQATMNARAALNPTAAQENRRE